MLAGLSCKSSISFSKRHCFIDIIKNKIQNAKAIGFHGARTPLDHKYQFSIITCHWKRTVLVRCTISVRTDRGCNAAYNFILW